MTYIPMVEMADGTTYYLKVERLFPSNEDSALDEVTP